MTFFSGLRLPPGAAIAVYAGEIPYELRFVEGATDADRCVIGVTYYGEPLMLFSWPRETMDALPATIQPVLDAAQSRRRPPDHGAPPLATDAMRPRLASEQ